MKNLILLLISLAVCGCATDAAHFTSKYERCNDPAFTSCLGVDTVRCDAEFSEAEALCKNKLAESPLVSNMDNYMKMGFLAGCMVKSISLSINKSAQEAMQCAK
ncbi:hypothetical protein O5O45_07630 [Hahella aquimaris]|uniref:hypothetical protein n=1 Tax=Hahella sp. HNIBRBA332 TaxID=3015983 RepID=UPI00273B189C|nr:hypothetical protein [Hahella sp. HNIBRBA332]WLQ15783.1 hypothetical protein O5O45_07630 [Hahella sp. HNIBRBA332]